VRLLLDEHYSPQIAEELRNRGHEVAAVAERTDLAAIADRELLARATSERRALLTESAADSMPIVQELAASGDMHLGVVFSSPRSLPPLPLDDRALCREARRAAPCQPGGRLSSRSRALAVARSCSEGEMLGARQVFVQKHVQ